MKKILLFLMLFFSFSFVSANDTRLFDLGGSSNTNFYSTFSDNFVLTGGVFYNDNFGNKFNKVKVEVIWSGDKKSYILKKFTSGDEEFKYYVSVKNKNLNEGTNIYNVSYYGDGKKFYTYNYEVSYINKNRRNTYILKKLEEKDLEKKENVLHEKYQDKNWFDQFLTEGWGFKSDFYTFDKEKGYLLGIDSSKLGKHILNLPNGYSMIYTVSYKDGKSFSDSFNYKVKIGYTDKNGKTKYSEEKNLYITYEMFINNYLKIYDKGKILITAGGGYEGVPSYYYFNSKDFKIYDIYENVIKKNLGKNYETVFDLNIVDNKLVINESKYCCDIYYNQGGFEKMVFDGDNLKLISRNLISPLKKGEWGSEFESIKLESNNLDLSVNSEDYGFSVLDKDKKYKVINPNFIDDYYKDKKPNEIKLNFQEISGKVYKDEYIEIEKLVE